MNQMLTTTHQLYAAFAAGDGPGMTAVLHPDVEVHVPGAQPLSGVHRGIDGALGFLHASAEAVDGAEQVEPLDFCAGTDHVAVLCHISGSRPGRPDLDNLTVHVHRFDGGRIREIRFHNFDQTNVDAFWR